MAIHERYFAEFGNDLVGYCARSAVAQHTPIARYHWNDLSSRPGKECFVTCVHVIQRRDSLSAGYAQLFAYIHYGTPGNAGQGTFACGRRSDLSILDQEEIVTSRLSNISLHIQHEGFARANSVCFHLGRDAVDILA